MSYDLSSLETSAVPQKMLDDNPNLYHVYDGLYESNMSGQKIKIKTMKSNYTLDPDSTETSFYTPSEYEPVFLSQLNALENRIKLELYNVTNRKYGQALTEHFYYIELIGIGLPNRHGIYENVIRYYWTRLAQYRTVRFLVSAHISRNRLWLEYDCKRSDKTWVNLDPLC